MSKSLASTRPIIVFSGDSWKTQVVIPERTLTHEGGLSPASYLADVEPVDRLWKHRGVVVQIRHQYDNGENLHPKTNTVNMVLLLGKKRRQTIILEGWKPVR